MHLIATTYLAGFALQRLADSPAFSRLVPDEILKKLDATSESFLIVFRSVGSLVFSRG